MSKISSLAQNIFSGKRQKTSVKPVIASASINYSKEISLPPSSNDNFSTNALSNDETASANAPKVKKGKIQAAATRIFMRKFSNDMSASYCFTQPPLPSCGSDCLRGCSVKSPDDVDDRDVSSDDESVIMETPADEGRNSSDEDVDDAFEDFQETFRQAPPSPPSRAHTKIEDKTITRQKGDAESLKKYAYGKK